MCASRKRAIAMAAPASWRQSDSLERRVEPVESSRPLESEASDGRGSASRARADEAFRAHHRKILSFLRARTDADSAEELAQQVFADATRAFERRAEPSDVVAWLYTVASRRLADEIRRRARSAQRLAQLEMVAPPPVQGDQYGREVTRSLRRALLALAAEDQVVVTARLLEGVSFVELSERLGVSVPACKMRFSRALRLVRASMEADGLP